jgi:glycosyltransferase involved in cell wall biosynthesis
MKIEQSIKGITIIIPSIGRESLKPLLHSIHLDSSLIHHEILVIVNSRLIDSLSTQHKAYECLKFIAQDVPSISKSRNLGIASAHNEMISLIDDDDLWINGRFKSFMNLLSVNSASIVFGSADFIDTLSGKSKKLGRSQEVTLKDFLNQFQTFYVAKEKYFLHVGNCAFLRNPHIPTFNEKLAYLEDQIWVLESLLSGFKVLQASEITLTYFFSRNRSNNRWNIENEKEIYEILSNLDKNLARNYINRKSLKSLAVSGNKFQFAEAKKAIRNFYGPKISKRISLSFYSLIVYLARLCKKH